MNLGAEPKKLAILSGLVVVSLVGLYLDFSGDSTPETPRAVSTPTAAPVYANSASGTVRGRGRVAVSDFHPRQGSRPDERVDPASIDPELRLDLLAKVQAVDMTSPGRNIFQFGAAPPPDKPIAALPKDVPKIPVNQPAPQPVVPAGPPPPRPAPPIPLKFYGYQVSKNDGHRSAFLLDGDDIIVAVENQTVKQHYRIVRISLTSIVIEDTQSKSTQTLPLQEIPG